MSDEWLTEENKAKWVAALRSGKYAQAVGQLRREIYETCSEDVIGMGYCCLGVLYDTTGKEWDDENTTLYSDFQDFSDASLEWLGMSSDVQEILVNMNDGYHGIKGNVIRRHSFAEIADWVERHDLKTGKLLPQYSEEEED